MSCQVLDDVESALSGARGAAPSGLSSKPDDGLVFVAGSASAKGAVGYKEGGRAVVNKGATGKRLWVSGDGTRTGLHVLGDSQLLAGRPCSAMDS